MSAADTTGRDGIEFAAASDVGLRRANNQDSFVVIVAPDHNEWLRRGHLFMVADGMGAHAAGELASKMTADLVSLTYYKAPDESPVDAITSAFHIANERVYTRGQGNLDFRGMGTTSSVLLLLPEGAVAAHVGDSRVYRLRGDVLEQLSFDHSLVWEMQSIGKMRESEIELHVPKNIITRSMGPYPQVQVDLEGPFPLEVGDTFLLCSDGLSGQVEDEELGCILQALPPGEAVQTLIDLANLRGGPDNITVIVARVVAPEAIGSADAVTGPARARALPHDGQSLQPLAWIITGVLALATASMAFLGQWVVAAATGVAAVLSGTWMAVQRFSSPAAGHVDAGQLGKGPYRSYICQANSTVFERLAKVVQQLRDAAMEEHWSVDWQRFNAYDSKAMEAVQQRNYLQALREQCHGISFMMEEIRQQARRKNAAHEEPAEG